MLSKLVRQIRRSYLRASKEGGPMMRSVIGMSDFEFLAKFNLPTVQEYLGNNNTDLARSSLVAHYIHRSEPIWPNLPLRLTNVLELKDSEILKRADAITNFRFELGNEPEVRFNGKINWKYNPTSDPRARWTRELHRHRWLALLVIAYEKTQQSKYLHIFDEMLTDWIISNPPPKHKDESSVAWTLMAVGMRSVMWTCLFPMVCSANLLSEKTLILILKSLYDHAEYLTLYKTHGNHLLRESNGLACIGTYFLEFNRAEHWRDLAIDRLNTEIMQQINDDGSHYEMSSTYQWLVLDEFHASLELIRENNIKDSIDEFQKRLIAMYEYIAYILHPDGTLPQIGDGFMEHGSILSRIENAGSEFEVNDLIYIGSKYKKAKYPEACSYAFNNAGRFIMRSSWHEDSHYLLFNSGPHGGFHGHEDKLSIEVSAFGKQFIVDPGTYTYNQTDPYRNYFMSSQAHNTIMPIGESQIRRWLNRRSNVNINNADNIWACNENIDYVRGEYNDGYGEYSLITPKKINIKNKMVHTRHVLFVKPFYWIIFDELTHCRTDEIYQMLFHLMPDIDVAINSDKTACLKNTPSNTGMNIIVSSADNMQVSNACGQEDPIKGWYSNGNRNHIKAASTLIYEFNPDNETYNFSTLLFPLYLDEKVDVSFDQLYISDIKGHVFNINHHLGSDSILITDNSDEKLFCGFESCANIIGVRTSKDSEVIAQFDCTF